MVSFVFVHGAWSRPDDWDCLVEVMPAGTGCHRADLPSCSRADATLADDAAHVRAVVDSAVDDVVLVGHSYGGMVITEAGGHPRVRHLVYVAAVVPEEGDTAFDLTLRFPSPRKDAWVELRDDGTTVLTRWADDDDVYSTAALEYMRARPRRASSAASAVSPCMRAGWRTVPSTYVLARRDTVFSPEAQRVMAARTGRVVEADAGHFVWFDARRTMLEVLADVATTPGPARGRAGFA